MTNDRRTDLLATGALVWAAALFGTSFVVVKGGLDHVRPIPYIALRFLIAGVVLAAIGWWGGGHTSRATWRIGVAAGTTYTIGMVCQTYGLERIDASASAFLTYLLIVVVPIIMYVRTGRPPDRLTFTAIGVSLTGLVLLTGGQVGFGLGTVLTLMGAVSFALHLVQVGDAATSGVQMMRFNAIQCLFIGVVLAPLVPFTGGMPTATEGWVVIVYAAIFVTVLTLVPWGWAQRHVPPTRAALILLMEPVFAAIAGYATGERMNAAAVAGAALILAGAVLAELPALLHRSPNPARRRRTA
ncbi:MAG TPA: DMT family transporter [Acidimicrobiales bacterium]